MAKNKLSDLRDHLFETLEALKDKDSGMEIERARAITEVAGAIIQTAVVEVKYANAVGALHDSQFFERTLPKGNDKALPQ